MSRARLYNRTHGPTRTSAISKSAICDIGRLTLPQPRCVTCLPERSTPSCASEGHNRHLFKQMYNTVRVPASEYTMNKGALEVGNDNQNTRTATSNNQASDRGLASVVSRINVPTRGNSLRTTKTSLRPGALAPGGTGVDIKHNSYDRYLARIKGSGNLKEGSTCETVVSKAVMNNKPRKYNIVSFRCTC